MSEMPLPTAPVPQPAYRVRHQHPIVGWVLIVLGVLFLANSVLPAFDAWIAPVLFAGIGLLFLAYYASRPEQTWPILAGGALLSLAAVTAWSLFSNEGSGSVLFIGLAATFAGFAAAPPASAHRRWAFWTAGGCLLVAFLATGVSWAWPLLLIALGAWLLLRRSAGLRI
jgi:hypothetical protein